MYYSDGDSHAAHQQASFVPMFTATFTSQASEQAAHDLCGDDSNCLLDYAATNNAQLALTSANNTRTGTSTNQLFSKFTIKILLIFIVSPLL
jgi:non-ribosomal peptide synthetase component F